ncbi:MAG: phosphate regulon transcriptional regulatory protein PhoB [Gammaproteobacteria bacterium]|nr:phosphate regulon transcriptional regulatory protein PhoB [Gammaproteobacteria bacterium]
MNVTINSILVVEDDPEISELLAYTLDRAGFTTIIVATAEEALRQVQGRPPGLAIIDWMLPGASGIDLARNLRRDEITREMPLIMLTARGAEEDKLKGFDSGIDDYLTKPFSPRELIARVRSLMRRTGVSAEGQLEAGGLLLDGPARRVTINGQIVHLGPTEFRLLALLMQHPNRAFDRAQLLDRVWGRSVYVEERTVDVHVLRLRKTLAPFGFDGVVETVRGVGYRFNSSSTVTQEST